MSLGVLNNLSAVYAENNLNNTNNSLNTVLQQLSSGSKINSGADDAAGLSLVDGLQANQQALTQSETNATEGVGLLQVADGALSQVTSLLNRAVTLATEASNGTLNSSQDTAANQEYQSILSEISNIGITTTYNDAAVFGTNTNIYTGDSSTTGSSIDALDTLDTASLDSVLNSDYSGVVGFFQNANSWGMNFSTMLTNAGTSSPTGILSLASSSNSNIESTLNADISKEEQPDFRAANEPDCGIEQRQRDHAGVAFAVGRRQRTLFGDHRLQPEHRRLRSFIPMGSYQEHALDGASAVDLVVALYDGILRFLYAASCGRGARQTQAGGGLR